MACMSLASIAVKQAMAKAAGGRSCLFNLIVCRSSGEAKVGTQGRPLEAGTGAEAVGEHHLLAGSPWIAQLAL